MKLYLVQHAKAASEQQDPQRSLTAEGKEDVQKVAAFIKPLNLDVDAIWHSGKKRTVQTAEILAGAVSVREGIMQHDRLGPNDDVSALRDELAAMDEDIMIVGHLPFLSKLASLLLAGSESADTTAFKNGGIVCLSRGQHNRWQVDWMVIPELLV
ncbi:MAG TPA: phosphohistidine phosphatase SixA [Sedimentisphaerales bacterium]|nr:phosphohistidine phosphatase SixA [Sedimentisphaerales bacterium]